MAKEGPMNTLYYGDNLDILREHISDESVDLIYLDPPFNSNRSYNVLFKEANGTSADSQITAFDDTWIWGQSAEATLREIEQTAPAHVVEMMQAIVGFVGRNDLTAYLVMMTIRLIELHRVLKSTGSIYLHCDPTASHYLKVVMDAIFGPGNFRNEIVWKRTSARSDSHRWNHIHDILLFYSKSADYAWRTQFMDYEQSYVDKFYRFVEEGTGRRYTSSDLMAAGTRSGESGKAWRGIDPATRGNHWKYTVQKLDELDKDGRILWPKKLGGVPRYKRYLDEMRGVAIQSIVTDIPPLSAASAERLGYPTQKPLALLERIIRASSNPDDLILDPFCGCGTTIAVAQATGRRWIGIDVTHLAVNLMKSRLRDMFGDEIRETYAVIGQPTDLSGGCALALQDRQAFEDWALGLIDARSAHGSKRGADQGTDGVLYFRDEAQGKAKKVSVQVKSGQVHANMISELCHVVEREKAVMGFFITLESATRPMLTEALSAGYYHSPGWNRDYHKIQIRSVQELLDGEHFDMPPANITLPQAERVKEQGDQGKLL